MNQPVMYFTSDSFQPNDSPASFKFGLSLKMHEAEQVAAIVREVQGLPEVERRAWLDEHGETIDQALQDFADKATETLDGMALDTEAMTMTADLVKNLREVVATLQSLDPAPKSRVS